MRRFMDILLACIPFAIIFLSWQLLSLYGSFPEKLVPDLGQIAQTFVRLASEGVLWEAAKSTLYRLLLGFIISGFVGVFLGILMGRYKSVEDTLLPLISFVYPIPGIAYAPLFVLWFGLGDVPAILLIAFASHHVSWHRAQQMVHPSTKRLGCMPASAQSQRVVAYRQRVDVDMIQ